MNLSSVINQLHQNYTQATGTDMKPSMLEQNLRNGMEALMGRLSGQVVTGEVVYADGSEILLSLGKDQLLQASLEGNMTAKEGQLLSFLVRNQGDAKVILSPLYENTAWNPSIDKALEAAGLPKTLESAAMVKAMMEEGMPIDKQSLYQMNRIINNNPEVNLQTLVQMNRLQLPITEENIAQFEAYKNYEHQIAGSITDIVDAFSQTASLLTGSEDMTAGLSFYSQVLDLLTQERMPEEALTKELPTVNPDGAATESTQVGDKGAPMLTKTEAENLAEQMKQAGLPETLTDAAAKGEMNGQTLLREVGLLLQKEELPSKESVLHLLQSKEFQNVLKEEMTRQWMLRPEEVEKQQNVDKLYERLNEQMGRLSKALSQIGGGEMPLAQTVTQVTQNIDFMNQLNQSFPYVQIPLKMQGQDANGELFVYTNKKSLARKDGAVSALLHLDMEHLGSVDVHVSLTGQKVATQFYLQDDAALDLIADHIDLLNQRLEKRGYSMTAQFLKREEQTNMMEEILKQDKNISVLSDCSFDARA